MIGKFPNGLGAAMKRERKGPTELANAIGAIKQDVSRWAKQERKLPPAAADKLAPLLNTTASALLLLTEEPAGEFRTMVVLGGYVVAGGQIDLSNERPDPNEGFEAGVFAEVPDASVAYEVFGESMRPRFYAGSLVICAPSTKNVESLLEEEAVIGSPSGGRYLKILHRGSAPGRFHLESHNAPMILDAEVEWAAEIVAVIPARKWRKLQRNALPDNWRLPS